MKLKYHKIKFRNMKVLAFVIVGLIILSGCTTKTIETQTPASQAEGVQQQTELTENTAVEVITSEPSGPKTYQVNIIQGIGVDEGAG